MARLSALRSRFASGEITPERRARFLQEARAASALNHLHIVHIYDVARAADDNFIVMEYVEGTRSTD